MQQRAHPLCENETTLVDAVLKAVGPTLKLGDVVVLDNLLVHSFQGCSQAAGTAMMGAEPSSRSLA